MTGPAIEITAGLRVEVSAAVVLGVRLLALPHADLDRELRAAADRNPALVVRELPCCDRCGRRSAVRRCAQCRPAPAAAVIDEPGEAAAVSAWEQLRRDLLAAIPSPLAAAGMTVLAALDERGLLDPAAVAALPADARDTVMAALRDVGPPGIGAATTQESLLRQLDEAPLSPADRALAARVLSEHAGVLAEDGPAAAARAAGCSPDRLTALLARLSRLLRPYPGLTHPASATDGTRGALPDVLFERHGDTVRAVVPECERWAIDIDDGYRSAVAAARPGTDPAQLATVRDQLREARTLIGQVQRRWTLLTRLAALLAGEHADQLLAGSTTFTRLTQRSVAARLGVHESTISRAVRHRTARLIDGQVVPLGRFFGAHHQARAAVAELVGRDPRPSDREVAEALTARGYRIARRTVAKYRLAGPC